MMWLIFAAVFLPLFPFSVVFNALLTRLRHPVARFVLMLMWPQIGAAAIQLAGTTVPQAFLPWALASAALYALRLLTARDLGVYAGFLASSSLALTWGLGVAGASWVEIGLFAFWFSLPAAALGLLSGPLIRRFGAAYAGICTGIGRSLPRLSTGLVFVVLAGVATAPFPTFFAQWLLLRRLDWTAALAVLTIWLIWGWAATLLLRGFVFGTPRDSCVVDIGRGAAWALWTALAVFVLAGIYLIGVGA